MDVGSIKNSLNPGLSARSPANEKSPRTVETKNEEPVERAAGDGEKISREQVESAVSSIQEFVQSVRRNINFSLEAGSDRVVVKVTDADSGDVIRQIPSEEALQMAENLEEVRSLLFNAKA